MRPGFENTVMLDTSGGRHERPEPPKSTSQMKLGRYQIYGEIGKGAMGVVYRARDPMINREVALKAIPLADEFEGAELEDARTKFFREAEMAGRLCYHSGDPQAATALAIGTTALERWAWHHVVLTRDGHEVKVYLDGRPQPEIVTRSSVPPAELAESLFFGGRCNQQDNWEGRLDEISVFDRVLTTQEIATLAGS